MRIDSKGHSEPGLIRAIVLSFGAIIGVGLSILFLYFAAPYLQSILLSSFAIFVKFCDLFGYANIILSFLSTWAIITYVVLRGTRKETPQAKFTEQYRNIACFVAALTILNILFVIGYSNSSLPSNELRVMGVSLASLSIVASFFFCIDVFDKVHDNCY